MSFRLSRTFSPFLVLSAVALAGCKVDVSLGGAGTESGSSSGGGPGGGTSSSSGEGTGGGTSSGGGSGGEGGGGGGGGTPSFTPDKVDLLFVVDNSGSMADKQEVLDRALDDLLGGLINPPCVDAAGVPVEFQPNALNDCPEGSSRTRPPVQDMHIGVISSSLGGHGASTCPSSFAPSNADMGHLLARSSPVVPNDLPTYQNKGFLAWDAAGTHVPAGDSDLLTLTNKLTNIIRGVGQQGCGFEAPLESFYRFLADPEPYAELALDPGTSAVVPQGVDETVLQQRREFLRPDSLLLIVMLTDENDCSIKDYGRNYIVAETRNNFRMWRPRSECAVNPNDPCCASCSQAVPEGCPADPTCTGSDDRPARLTVEEDPVNLRCFDQKRRFGYDFLYPIERYTQALTSPQVLNRDKELVPNPIFSDLDPSDGNSRVRGPQHVVFTGIVGVPWQDIARDPADLGDGLKNAAQLSEPLASGATTWDVILGDPSSNVMPQDPHMRESSAPRSGVNPITGDAIAPPGSATNPINGSEYTIPFGSTGDLQYACIFPLLTSRSCDATSTSCDCRDPSNDNPLCAPNPADGGDRTLQVRGKAYPGLRELQLIQSLGDQGVAASICPAQLSDTAQADYGYQPVVKALIERLDSLL
ncbi:hypothetical protein SOCE26_062290 [Sorangium cellulosum]|uniref:VWFA domain-containing protein n=1 Tax=Sorangium cellulosum TaxID=56 RepID=A0A2L0EZN1_SORCE|nr:hypothetical protein [Sorangium cellulosum]AUX44761.1 hypothetical protein SOCE26_062290 [Sorangium cellulosum]